MELTPLMRSAEYDEVESEFKALFKYLYMKHVDTPVMEANTLGMPHLGPDPFISRNLNNDGLALLNDTTSQKTRQLFLAWSYLNPQRGTDFLRFYLRALFGDVFTIEQLWCRKSGTYPVDVMSTTDIERAGEQLDEFFLTSRLRVDIETEIVPQRILNAARSAVAAKFVLELRAARKISVIIPIIDFSHGVAVMRSTGKAVYHQPLVKGGYSVRVGFASGATTLAYSSLPRIDMQTVRK